MKLSLIRLCVAGAAAIVLQTGATVPVSSALAAEEGCIITNVTLHVRRCPPGATLETHAGGAEVPVPTVIPTVTPTVTPTAASPEGCIKTDVALHIRRCPAGV
jgi:hypothetical protein